MADRYTLHGFSDTCEPVLLESFAHYTHAEAWFKDYTRFGDWGGYDSIGLSEYSPEMGDDVEWAHKTGLIIIWDKEEE